MKLSIVDVLTDLLQRSRARGAAFSYSTAHGSWGLRFAARPGLAVHAILDGELQQWTDDPGLARRLVAGDIILVRGDVPHHLAHAAGAPSTSLADHLVDAAPAPTARRVVIGEAADGPAAVFFCGAYRFDGDLCSGLLGALPETVHLRPPPTSALQATMDLLAREMLRDAPGQQALLDRLLDVALVQVLREHFFAQGHGAPPWFRAMDDPRMGAALRALHADPARPWTVTELASEAMLSRAAFARRFTALLGAAPMTYVTGWRMALARERLRDTDDGLAAIARSLGYASEFSFAAAFKRHHGTAPGRWRAELRGAVVGERVVS